MVRTKTLLALLLGISLALAGCGAAKQPAGAVQQNKLTVVTSIYPLYEFARQVGGERVNAVNLVPPGAEPHDWEPTPRDLQTLNKAAVLLFNGIGLEPWVGKTVKSLDNKGLLAVEVSRDLGTEAGHDDGHGHEPAGADPHTWLDPVLAQQMVERVREALVKADPAGAEQYGANARAYQEKLAALHEDFKASLGQGCRREFVTSHAAFGYLARRYNLEQVAIAGLSPEVEPSPKDVAAIVAEAREHGATHIFFETLVSPKIAETVAREIGAETLVLNPLEGLTPEELAAGKDYLTVQRENLKNLKLALGCGQ